ncbi:Hypothetical protein CINCED_3A004098 [Cinara cedri]|uniref:Uncharacterized protein n=1 Tax=Cinara cedri TaxID=506608 RepID=A0A5E4NEB1_9HEMI|nr:Hypothetical protein CINCED_3A004098 [Cinara cedri]
MKNETFKSYLCGLSAIEDPDYSLWKATRQLKRPRVHIPPIRKKDGTWARSDQDKAELNDIVSELDSTQCQPLNFTREFIRYFTPLEVTYKIDTNINTKNDTWVR